VVVDLLQERWNQLEDQVQENKLLHDSLTEGEQQDHLMEIMTEVEIIEEGITKTRKRLSHLNIHFQNLYIGNQFLYARLETGRIM
jgi:hypothetical protein